MRKESPMATGEHTYNVFIACLCISLTRSLVEAVKKTWWCVTRVAVIKGICEEREGEEDEEEGRHRGNKVFFFVLSAVW